MSRSMRTFTIASIIAAGLFFPPAAYATHPHDAPGATSGSGMMGEGGMMGRGGMMEMMHMMMGMGGMMAMMNQMNQMMESCTKMMGSASEHHGSGAPEEKRKMDVPAVP